MEQDWNHILFLHWKISPDLIQSKVPFDLDLFEGNAVVSIVPFQMNRIRFPFLPVVPFFSSLWELNLRTYVQVNGAPGVYFFTLDTDSRLGSLIANRFFHLPYRLAKMTGDVSHQQYCFSSSREGANFKLKAKISNALKNENKNELDAWATDREHLFTEFKKKIYQGTVIHAPWRLQKVEEIEFEDRFSSLLNLQFKKVPDEIAYCEHLSVRFRRFQIVG